jgi:3-phosphoshikimate 1-carboxyvinyltransferase
MSASIRVRRLKRLNAHIRVPGDKSISHRAAMLAGLAGGTSRIGGYLKSEDCLCTLRAMQALGAEVLTVDDHTVDITGVGGKCQVPLETIDCGNSGTSMRLLSGILAGQKFTSRLTGDSSLCSRPMKRIMEPLARMGAVVVSERDNGCAPLRIEGGELTGIRYESPIASAQVKSCLLLAGLFAKGSTTVVEPVQSRDHTERMLRYFYVPIQTGERTTSVHGGDRPEPRDFTVPGDFSSAAFWLAAGAAFPGGRVTIVDVGLNPTRTALLSVLLRMGAGVREFVDTGDDTEPRGNVEIMGGDLTGTVIGGAEIPNLIDEIPILAVLGALAEGETVIKDARELRHKESDRIATVVRNLRAFGVRVEESDDGMVIQGGGAFRGAVVESHGDHRIAMASCILGLFCDGDTRVNDTDCIATSYPGFEKTLRSL